MQRHCSLLLEMQESWGAHFPSLRSSACGVRARCLKDQCINAENPSVRQPGRLYVNHCFKEA
jgi:hypothetical protein